MLHRAILLLTLSVLTVSSYAGEVYETLPDTPHSNVHYVFYSHGFIVEGTNPTPVNPRWGKYDFPAVKQALSDSEYHLIATHRPAQTNPFEYAKGLAKQAQTLIDAGVDAHNISFVGFSRGGFITAITSSLIKNQNVNYVILAACTSGLAKHPDITLHGKVFSIYETSDTVGSCHDVVKRGENTVSSYSEIAISTGKEHGAFYRPLDEWVTPVKAWLKRKRG